MNTKSISQILRTEWFLIGVLLLLTAIEFGVTLTLTGALLLLCLLIIGLVKAGLIIQYFMHFGQLWKNITDIWWGILLTSEEEE